jgi:zinc protease
LLDARAELVINAIYHPMNVAKVVSDVEDELARLLRDGTTTAELDRAKRGYLEQQNNQRANDMSVSSTLAENLFAGRTMQFHADLEQKIGELTPEAVNSALRKYIDLKRLSIVTAGDFKEKSSQSSGSSQ